MDSVDPIETWVDAARAGGDWAFARLWERLSPSVAGYLRTRGVADSEDVTSEVFLAAFQGIGTFKGDAANFRSWLFTIAHHRAVDSLRRETKRRHDVSYDPVSDSRGTASAEDTAMSADRAAETGALLNLLTAEQRDVLSLRFVADLSLDEVSTVTGRSVDAVKQLQRRGIAALRRHLDGSTSASPIPLHAVESMTETR